MILKPKKEAVLKTFIFIGIIAIIISLYIQYAKPYQKELSLQKEDEQRINDLDKLNGIIKDLILASSTQFIGDNNIIYISLPSDDSKCTNFDLPSVPEGWQYHCVATSTLNKTDGTGWMPLNISGKINRLPIDPINNPKNLEYYSYTANSTTLSSKKISTEYVVTAKLGSKKYIKNIQGSSKVDDARYEVGSNSLWSDALGIIGYWQINEGHGDIVFDKSGNNIDGQIIGYPDWQKNNEFQFNNEKDKNFILFKNDPLIDKLGMPNVNYSISFWIKNPKNINQSITEKWIDSQNYPWAIRIEQSNIVYAKFDGKNWISTYTDSTNLSDGFWHQVVCVNDSKSKSLKIYIDNVLMGTIEDSLNTNSSNKNGFTIGARNNFGEYGFNGSISKFIIYNKALNNSDMSQLFIEQRSYFLNNN